MRFIVTSEGNHSTCGEVFFNVPTDGALQKAAFAVKDLCYKKLHKLPPAQRDLLRLRFEKEFEKMIVTKTAFHFLIVKEIAKLSREQGYPVGVLGDVSGSVILYLLGVTEYDEMCCHLKYSAVELLWGVDEDDPKTPDFSLGIAPVIRPLLSEHLDEKYGYEYDEFDVYKRISLTDLDWCETLGKLAKVTGQKPTLDHCDPQVYRQVLLNLAKNRKENDSDFVQEPRDAEQFGYELEEITDITCFLDLIRVFAYECGMFYSKKELSHLTDPHFYVTRDEFFFALTTLGVPRDEALDIVKLGIYTIKHKRQELVKTLEQYHLPQFILDYFVDVSYLWRAASCISRLRLMCYEAWYQIHYPKEYDDLA